jgi:phosphatidylglycerophosphatase A
LIYFRVFDIWKPSIIGRIDRDVKGGLGVMGDDLLAGVVAVICSGVTYEIYRYLI